MAVGWPPEINVALLKRRLRQVALEESIVQAQKEIRSAKRACRMQEEPTGDRVVTMYHLLQPRADMNEPRHLEA